MTGTKSRFSVASAIAARKCSSKEATSSGGSPDRIPFGSVFDGIVGLCVAADRAIPSKIAPGSARTPLPDLLAGLSQARAHVGAVLHAQRIGTFCGQPCGQKIT